MRLYIQLFLQMLVELCDVWGKDDGNLPWRQRVRMNVLDCLINRTIKWWWSSNVDLMLFMVDLDNFREEVLNFRWRYHNTSRHLNSLTSRKQLPKIRGIIFKAKTISRNSRTHNTLNQPITARNNFIPNTCIFKLANCFSTQKNIFFSEHAHNVKSIFLPFNYLPFTFVNLEDGGIADLAPNFFYFLLEEFSLHILLYLINGFFAESLAGRLIFLGI